MTVPRKVIDALEHVQRMYIREFERVEALTDNILAGRNAADRLLFLYKQKTTDPPKEERVMVTMTAHITEMSTAQILPADILSRIKTRDPHPFFAIYKIGESGSSTGNATKNNQTITRRKLWSFGAIKELTSKMKEGLGDVIIGHGTTKIVGKVVHAYHTMVNQTMHALAVVHITHPETISRVKTKELDVCSVEGTVTLARNSRTDPWRVKAIEWINRLALGNSVENKPGFSGASIQATIQELERNEHV